MKKNLCLILSIFLLIIIFFYNWYYIEILDTLFLLTPIITFLLSVAYILLLINILNKLKQNKNIFNIINFLILLFIVILILFFPFIEIKTKYEFNIYKEERNNIIKLIKNNKLSPDQYGNIKLPKNLKKLSNTGEVSIYRNNKEEQLICFWIIRGLQGDESIRLIYSTTNKNSIENNTKFKIKRIKKIEDNWYYVITNY